MPGHKLKPRETSLPEQSWSRSLYLHPLYSKWRKDGDAMGVYDYLLTPSDSRNVLDVPHIIIVTSIVRTLDKCRSDSPGVDMSIFRSENALELGA